MLSVYVKEQRPYERRELQRLLKLEEDSFLPFTERLRAYGLLKTVSASGAGAADRQTERDLEEFAEWEETEQDPDPCSEGTGTGVELYSGLGESGAGTFPRGPERDSRRYRFTFVGILQAGERILKSYPKYIEEENPAREMKQILKVLRRYHARRQTVSIYESGDQEEAFNRLAVMLYLVEDYLEHGVYTNWQPVTEVNGSGEILWDPTIHETVALMVGGRPFYPELLTEGSNHDEHDYFRRLHRCIVTECSRALEDAGLTELLELERLYETDEQLEELGDEEYILYRIRRELEVRFDDRRSRILRLMDTYIAHRHMPETGSGLYLFGTDHFEYVWEDVCKETLGNCLKKPLGMLIEEAQLRADKGTSKREAEESDKAGTALGGKAAGADGTGAEAPDMAGGVSGKQEKHLYKKGQTLLDLIERPRWRYKNTKDVTMGKGTLVPDLITIYDRGGERCFAILDAKYYRIRLGRGRVSGQPGIGDITKQYLYQLAYEDFIRDMGYGQVQNVFLFPGCGDEAEYLGRVELAMLAAAGRRGLSHIAAVKLPTVRLYDAYLAGREEEPGSMLACVPKEQEPVEAG